MNIIKHEKSRTIVEIVVFTLAIVILASCDLRSGIAREEGEKLNGTPTPTVSPTPTLEPIDPADIVQVDTSQTGDELAINRNQPNKTVACTKYNDVQVNGDSHNVTITGVCSEITVNGDNNRVTADAAMRFVVNGDGNTIDYLKFPNGQRPSVKDNGGGNVIEKISANTSANKAAKSNNAK
jgi:hypothetical protein